MPTQPSMKWYKFIIYCQLILAPLIDLFNAYSSITGVAYEAQGAGTKDLVYRIYPSLETIDKVYGFLLIGLAVLGFIARQKLAKFSSIGPKLYFAFLGATLGAVLFYLIGLLSIFNEAEQIANLSSLFGNVIGLIILICVNIPYFKNREHLFINE